MITNINEWWKSVFYKKFTQTQFLIDKHLDKFSYKQKNYWFFWVVWSGRTEPEICVVDASKEKQIEFAYLNFPSSCDPNQKKSIWSYSFASIAFQQQVLFIALG